MDLPLRFSDDPSVHLFVEHRLELTAACQFHRVLEIPGVDEPARISRCVAMPRQNAGSPRLTPKPVDEKKAFHVGNRPECFADIRPVSPNAKDDLFPL
jgi:hypothetical protein